MIIRFKKINRPEIMELMADPDSIDYWIDTMKNTLCVEIYGKIYTVRRGKETKLKAVLDLIHEAVKKRLAFVDLTDSGTASFETKGNDL